MVNAIITAKVTFNSGKNELSVSDLSYPNGEQYDNTLLKKSLNDFIKDKINSIPQGIISGNEFYVQIIDNKSVEMFNPMSSQYLKKDITDDLSDTLKIAIKTANYSQPILSPNADKIDPALGPNTQAKKSQNILKNAFKCFLSGLDFVFVKKLWHAKGTDIAAVALFSFTALALGLAIFAPHISLLHIAQLGAQYSHPAFGLLNITVGGAIFTQGVKNFIKAKKNNNKEEMALAIISILFSFAIIATGITATCNFSNDIILKSLWTTCASFTFGVGIYNTIKTQMFRKKINDAKNSIELQKEYDKLSIAIKEKINALNENDKSTIETRLKKHLSEKEFKKIKNSSLEDQKETLLKLELQALKSKIYLTKFFKDQLGISETESKAIEDKINAIEDNKKKEIEKLLKKHLSTKDYNAIKSIAFNDKKVKLIELEKEVLNRKKTANVERILRRDLTQRAKDFINGKEDLLLEKDLKKELFKRNFADALRLVATSLSIGAFSFNVLAPIDNINLQNLIYYSTMLIAKLSGSWQNYFPGWRNVPAEENKKIKEIFKSKETKVSPLENPATQPA